jgi:uncharacterized protein (UPF0333 family)
MIKTQGQVLTEFVLILVVLVIATTGIFSIYKKFWKTSYQKVSTPSSVIARAVTHSNYVK